MKRPIEKEFIYKSLENQMLGYGDYAQVPVQPNNEPLVPIVDSDALRARQISDYMQPFTGDRIYVREGVLERLTEAAALLVSMDPKLHLDVISGYRALEVQIKKFEARKAIVQQETGLEGDALLSEVHRSIAVPGVAGHPAGAAVDLQIVRNSTPLDFGTPIHGVSRDSYAHSPFIGKKARINREMLRGIMTEAQFAPYDGEWWHFSNGDKEAARSRGEPFAVYEQLDFRETQPSQ